MYSATRKLFPCILSLVALLSSATLSAKNPFKDLAYERLRCYTQQETDDVTSTKKLFLNIPTLDPHTIHSYIYDFYSTTNSQSSFIANHALRADLELIEGSHTPEINFIKYIDNTTTAFGTDYLTYVITHPNDSITILTNKQNAVKILLSNKRLAQKLNFALEQVAHAQNNFIYMYEPETAFNRKTIASFYFGGSSPLKGLNSNTPTMQAITMLDRIPSAALLLWYPILQWGLFNHEAGMKKLSNGDLSGEELTEFIEKHFPVKDKIDFKQQIKFGLRYHDYNTTKEALSNIIKRHNPFHFSSEDNQAEDDYSPSWGDDIKSVYEGKGDWRSYVTGQGIWALTVGAFGKWGTDREKTYNNLTNYMHAQLIAVSTVVRAMKASSNLIKQNPELAAGLEHKEDLHALFSERSRRTSVKLRKLCSLLLTNTFKGEASYLSMKGRVLAAYSLMQDVKNEFAPALRALGEVDVLLSTAKLYRKFENERVSYSFPTYIDKEQPEITLVNMWNPFVPTQKVVTNSIILGNTMPQNIILTGPNAGGKSCFLKGVTLSVLMAQTLGIAPVQELILTPFAKINTYMNVTDDTAAGNSLFKSEVLRAQGLLDTVKNLNSKKFSLSIMDEMFSGTSPKEGAAAGYGVAKRLGALNNSILLLATHFPLLTELEDVTNNFKNYQVRVVRHGSGSFSYPYKLEDGKADQNVAIDILKQQGFDASILDDANEVLNR